MDEEYELDTLLDIIQDYTNANQEEYARTMGRLPVCSFRHANPAGNQPTSSRRAVRLLQHVQQARLGHPLPEHDPERVSLFRSSIGTNWVNAICNKSQYEKAHEALDFALAIDDKQHRDIDLESIPLPARQANIKESYQLLSPSGKGDREETSRLYGIGWSPLRDEGLRNRHEVYTKAAKTETGDNCIRANRVYIVSQPSVMPSPGTYLKTDTNVSGPSAGAERDMMRKHVSHAGQLLSR